VSTDYCGKIGQARASKRRGRRAHDGWTDASAVGRMVAGGRAEGRKEGEATRDAQHRKKATREMTKRNNKNWTNNDTISHDPSDRQTDRR